MFKSLYSRLAVVLLVLFCMIGIFFIGVTVYSTEMYQNEINQKLNQKLADNIVAEHLLLKDGRINDEGLNDIFHMLMVINPSIELYLLDPDGNILSYSAPPGKVKLSRINLKPVWEWFDPKSTYPILGEDPKNPGLKKAIAAARIPEKGRLEGYLYIILASEIYDSSIQKFKGSHILRLSLWIIVSGVLFAIVAGFLIFAFMTRRLKKLSLAMDSFKEGATINKELIPTPPDKIVTDEIDQLSVTFYKMAEHITTQMNDIKDADTLRRDLIANVSHDLRTPIATLQGYIETLQLKGLSLEPEERNSYLETARKQCDHLGKLVGDLFELARLDSKEAIPEYEYFDIRELVQDVGLKFSLATEQKKIILSMNLETDIATVYADIGMIERVLVNLIDNAIHHTQEGGSVHLALGEKNKHITVEISDTGCGITEDELNHIFMRFYKLDKSRKNSPNHSGLGLAITKRILDLHNASIDVSSELNKGTSFIIYLPTATKHMEPQIRSLM